MILSAFKPCKMVKVVNENMRLNLSDEGVLNFLVRGAEGGDREKEDDAMYLNKRWKRMATLRIGILFLNVRYCASLLSCKNTRNVSYRVVKTTCASYHRSTWNPAVFKFAPIKRKVRVKSYDSEFRDHHIVREIKRPTRTQRNRDPDHNRYHSHKNKIINLEL